MSNRITLVNVVLTAGFADLRQIRELIPQWHAQKIKDTIRDCVKAGLIERTMDSGELCYAVATKGKQWQKDQSGDYVTAPEDADHVVVPPPQDYAQGAEAAKDAEIEKLRGIIDLMSKDHQKASDTIARLSNQLEFAEITMRQAETQRNAWREMAAMYGHETPVDLAGFIGEKIHAAESAEVALSMAIETPIKDDANKEPIRGYVVADANAEDIGPVFADIDDAKLAAIINAVSTGKKSAVFAMLDCVESVDIKWANQSPKVLGQVAGA